MIIIIIAVREVGCLERAGPPGVEGSLRETCTKQGVFDPGQGRVWGGGSFMHVALRVPNYKCNSSPGNFATAAVSVSFQEEKWPFYFHH